MILGSPGSPPEETAKENCSCSGIVAIKEGQYQAMSLFLGSFYLFIFLLIFEIGSGYLCILGCHQTCDPFASASPGLGLQRSTITATYGNNFVTLSGGGPSVSWGDLISLVGFPYVSDQC